MSVAYNPLSGNFETKEPGPQGPAGTVSAAGDGSEGAPSISFASQPNTGLYKYASESIAVSTGGTGRLFVNSSGNLGIGASDTLTNKVFIDGGNVRIDGAPSTDAKLEIRGDNSTSSSTDAVLSFVSYLNNNSGGSNADIRVTNAGGSYGQMIFSTRRGGGANIEAMRLDSSGNLKLGGNPPTFSNISLNASGTATYTGDVISGTGNYSSGNNAALHPQGNVSASRISPSDALWFGFTTGNSSPTSVIKADGTATFAAGVTGNYFATNTTAGSFNFFRNQGASSAINTAWGDTGGAQKIKFFNDGGATFDGQALIGSGTAGASKVRIDPSGYVNIQSNVSNGQALRIFDPSSTQKTTLKADGSAALAGGNFNVYSTGSIQSGSNTSPGQVYCQRPASESSPHATQLYRGFYGNNEVFKVNTNGSTSFTGFVTEAPVTNYYTSATPSTGDTNSTGSWATNASTAPDGTRTASKFTASSTPASSRFQQVSSSVNLNSTAYTLSFYAKSESGSSQSINVDLGDDQAGSITVTTSWQRFVFTSLVPTSGRFIDFGGIDGNWSLWGVQIQTENAATSYVKPSGGVATTSSARATVGTRFSDYSDFFVAGDAEIDGDLSVNDALTKLVRNDNIVLNVKRLSSVGKLVTFLKDNTEEGDISVSGSTVSLNGAHLTRWSQLANGAQRTEILRGSVLSNLDEMCEWQYGAQAEVLYTAEDELPEGVNVGDVKVPAVEASIEDNEQLNRMKVSDVEGDRNVAGVFQSWDDDDDTYTNDFYCAMTGDFVIRIAQGTTVARGDLLMSAGDGTAKPQDDDIVRSKTIAKVTSTVVSETYSDGSYCVPCVLMAC